jgi:hypothetical protein
MKVAHTCVTAPISVMTNLASLTTRRAGGVGVPPGAPHPRPADPECLQCPALQPGHEPSKVKFVNIKNNVSRLTLEEKELE